MNSKQFVDIVEPVQGRRLCCAVGSMQQGSRTVLSQRSINLLNVNRSQSTSEPKFLDVKPNSSIRHNYGSYDFSSAITFNY